MKKSLAFWVCLIISIGLFVGGFFVPPTGVIDGSVITSVGILFGFAALGQLPVIIETAGHAKITQGNMVIEVGKKRPGGNHEMPHNSDYGRWGSGHRGHPGDYGIGGPDEEGGVGEEEN